MRPLIEVGDRGGSLLEIVVALACTGLVAAGTMPLLVDGAAAARQRHEAVEARGLADILARTLAADIEAAGGGIEGARSVERSGVPIALVEAPAADSLRVLLPVGASREVWPTGVETFWVRDIDGLAVGQLLAGVGLPGASSGDPAPGGAIAMIREGVGGGLVQVVWAAAESARIRDEGPPRALLPLRLREYATQPDGTGSLRVRRRDTGGTWQPVADGVDAVELAYALDVDSDGVADGPAAAGGVEPLLWPYIHLVVIRVSVRHGDGGIARAEVWARVGGVR